MKYTKEKVKEIITSSEYYKTIKGLFDPKNLNHFVSLTGGAILDILANRKPKDYDLISTNIKVTNELLLKAGCEFLYSSKTSYTFKKGDLIIQVLKTKVEEFDFTINQTNISLESDYINDLDLVSLNSNWLIPTEHSWNSSQRRKVCLKRNNYMWKTKNMCLPEITRKSLKKGLFLWSVRKYFYNKLKS